jgi:hypothetical protein
MAELLIFVVALVGFCIYKASKAKKHPNRLLELELALRTHADLWLHRNKDASASAEMTMLADDLRSARQLLNEGSESVHASWSRLRPQVLHLTSERALKSVDLFYTDRREEFKAAVYDLTNRLDGMDGKEAGASRAGSR